MPVPSLRAGLFIHLFIYLYSSLWKCATPFCLCVGRGNMVLCALVLECVFVCAVVCGPCLWAGRGNHGTFDHFDRGYVPPWSRCRASLVSPCLVDFIALRLLAPIPVHQTWPSWTRCHYRHGSYLHHSRPSWSCLVGYEFGDNLCETVRSQLVRWSSWTRVCLAMTIGL